jgi:hypothetical protein
MAKGIGVKVPRKKVRLAPVVKNKKNIYDFENCENWSGADYHTRVRNYKADLYANFKAADLAPEVLAWMKENDYTKAQIDAVKKDGPSVTAGMVCKLLRAGMMDLNPKHAEYWDSLPGTSGELKPATVWLKADLEKSIAKGTVELAKAKAEEKATSSVYVPTIQERITSQAQAAAEDIDVWLDGFIENKKDFDPKSFDFKRHFTKMGVTQAHARKLVKFYEGELEEFRELQNMPTPGQLKKMDERTADMWEQLKEGYAHLKKADVQTYITALESLVDACNYVVDASKAVRKPRIAKPKSADKVVAKLKFLKTDDKYKLASVNPVDIVGANELWVFNIKTRKLGKYVASNIDPTGQGRGNSGLQVKGTTITGFDEAQSIQKTLRKPEEQLKAFKTAGKVALRTFLDNIPTTDTKMNGRCNLDTVLLKVS